jgi:hypothetical protein
MNAWKQNKHILQDLAGMKNVATYKHSYTGPHQKKIPISGETIPSWLINLQSGGSGQIYGLKLL